jgi:hypothetical protein
MIFNWGVQYIIGNIFLKVIRFFPYMFQKRLVWRKYGCPKFRDNKSPNFGCHFDVIPTENHIIYYKERSGVSSQRWQAMQSLCFKLSLLSSSHHLHSTCTNHPFSLVVHVDFILNFCLWNCSGPILEL